MVKDIFSGLNDAQKQAVDTIDGPILVVAGPGTGKTQLLALRAANILQKTDVQAQNILCLTYTENAARNMRERLTQFIGKQAYDLRISTYHGFGSDIIREYSEYFTDFNANKPIDSIGQNKIMHQIYDELPATNVLWRPEVYLKDTLGFISEAKRNLLLPTDIRTIATDNQRAIKEVSKLTKKHLSALIKINKDSPELFKNLLLDLNKNVSNKTLPRNILALDQMALRDLAEAIETYNVTNKTNPITTFKNKWLAKDSNNNWVLAGNKEANKMLAAADIYELYLKKLQEQSYYDYDDMILNAIEGLKNNSELRYTLQEKYQYIMLDEFQDTNLAQLELISLLSNNPNSEGQPNVLAVGDDDQAIFSFQGADLTNMIRFYNMYKDVKTITLTENWRSHQQILDTSKYISEQIEERLHSKLGFDAKKLIAKNPKLPNKANIQRRHFKSDIAELDWVATKIANLVKNGAKATEIAVIAPKHKYLEPLVPYLQNQGVPIRYDKRENVFEDPNIIDVINSVKLVIALKDNDYRTADSLWPAVLSAKHLKLATSTIWQLSWQSSENRYKDKVESNWTNLMQKDITLKPIALFYIKLSQIAQYETLEAILDYIVGTNPLELNEPDLKGYRSPYYAYHFGDVKNPQHPILYNQLLSNLTVIRQKLRAYKSDGPLFIDDFIEFIDAYQNADEKLLNTSPYHESQDAVQLITAFGAKGLEFEYVFVLATLDDVWGMKARDKNSNLSLPENLKIIRHAGSNKDEKKRLFYVALTRAKHSLYITSFGQNYAGKQSTHLEFLDESEENGSLVSQAMPKDNRIVAKDDSNPPGIEAVQSFWHHRHIQDASQPTLMELIKPRLEGFQLSATHLNNFTDLVYGGPESFLLNTILRFPKGPSADGQYGNAIHETIDTLHQYNKKNGHLPEIEDIISIYQNKLQAKDLNKNDYKRMLSRGEQALQAFIPVWWHNFSPANQSEASFRNEGVFVDDAHLSGNLDHLLIDHENQELIVVDYKTGKSQAKWSKDIKMHKYRQQLLFYKLLLQGSHTYKKYSVLKGRLVFVEPDENGVINELEIIYDEQELDHLKQLIKAVWQRIMALDLPDVSQFKNDYKGTLEFEDWLINNSL